MRKNLIRRNFKRNPIAGLILALIIYVLMAYIYAIIKPMWCDEIWTAGPTLNMMEFWPSGSFIRWYAPLSYWSMGAWLGYVGYTLVHMRMHTVIWGVILLCGLFYIGKRNGYWVGVWAVLICGLDCNFLFCSDSRPDMMCSALGVWAFALGSEYFAAAAALVHPFGLVFPVVTAILKRQVNMIPYIIAAAIWAWSICIVPVEGEWGEFAYNCEVQVNNHATESAQAVFFTSLYQAYGTGWRLLLLATYVSCAAVCALKINKAWIPLGLIVMPALFFSHAIAYMPHAVPWLALCVAIQMQRYPWLALILPAQIIFTVRSLYPLWSWDGVTPL